MHSQTFDPVFCFLDIKILQDAYIGFFYLALSLIFFIITLKQFLQIVKYKRSNLMITLIYISIFGWILFYAYRISLAEYMFWRQHDHEYSHQVSNQISKVSSYLFVISYIGVLILQTAIFQVVYHWTRNILLIFENLIGEEETAQHLKMQLKIKKTTEFLMIGRCFCLIIPILFFLATELSQKQIIVHIVMVQLLIDDVLVLFLLGLLAYALNKCKKSSEIIEIIKIENILNKYTWLIICQAIRTGIQILFTYQNFTQITNSEVCWIGIEGTAKVVKQTIYTLIKGLATNYLPIFIILKIFQAKKGQNSTEEDSKLNLIEKKMIK